MLIELTIENIATIERCTVRFEKGFAVLTGETGSGKSLLIDSIDLALGGRADPELIRDGCANAVIALVADIRENANAQLVCRELEIDPEDDFLHLRREIQAEGRSTCRINGKMVTRATMRAIGASLVDLHTQHAHHSLLDVPRHEGILDDWIGDPAENLKRRVAEQFARQSQLRRQQADLNRSAQSRDQELDTLRYQIGEIDDVDPQIGELEALATQIQRCDHAATLVEETSEAKEALTVDESGVLDQLGRSIRALETAHKFDPALSESLEALRAALVAIQDVAWQLGDYRDAIETDPGQLEVLIHRQEAIRRLIRKYGPTEAAILEWRANAAVRFAELDGLEQASSSLNEELVTGQAELDQLAMQLTTIRRDAGSALADFVKSELSGMALAGATFEIRIEPKPMSESGADAVEFYFSGNAGEPVRPLARVGSGGELSRLMLAIRMAMAGRNATPTVIFDEVDTGLSGRTAAAVAKTLERLRDHHQLIVISHLPQIAAKADHHYAIEKGIGSGRIQSQITKLDEETRVEELARMLGSETIGASARANARELLGRSA